MSSVRRRSPASRPVPDLTLRAAAPADLDALVRLEESAFATDRLSRRSLRTLMARPSAALIVAEVDGRIVGALLLLFRRGSRIARLYSLSVAAEARGTGIGSALLSAADQVSAARGAVVIKLEVRTDNAGAISLYRRHGYRHAGDWPAYYDDGADAHRFAKTLSPPPPGRAAARRRLR